MFGAAAGRLTDTRSSCFYPGRTGLFTSLHQIHSYSYSQSLISSDRFELSSLIMTEHPLLNSLQHGGCPIRKCSLELRSLVSRINY